MDKTKKYRVWDGYQMTFQEGESKDGFSMEYTGFEDSNGVPVYECDIVSDSKHIGVIERSVNGFLTRSGTETFRLPAPSLLTVLGNAFEHAELI